MVSGGGPPARAGGPPAGGIAVRAIVAAAAAMTGILLTGCGGAGASGGPGAGTGRGTSPPSAQREGASSVRVLTDLVARRINVEAGQAAPPGQPVRYRDEELFATVSNAGTPAAFTAFATATREVTVQASSSAHVEVIGYTAPRLLTASERQRWHEAGEPSFPAGPTTGQAFSIPTGMFSFSPQGAPLTYAQARALPGSPEVLRRDLTRHLRPALGSHPPVPAVMTQLGFLLATAPLSHAARAAAWSLLASLPGLHLCERGRDPAGRNGQWVCTTSHTREAGVLLDTGTGAVLAVSERILTASRRWFPGVPAGSLVLSDAFLPLPG
jgi:hypothetical protein